MEKAKQKQKIILIRTTKKDTSIKYDVGKKKAKINKSRINNAKKVMQE